MVETLSVAIDVSPLLNSNAIRGVGTYTRWLTKALEKTEGIEVKVIETNTDKKQLRKLKPTIIHYPYFDFFKPTLPLVRSIPTVITIHDAIPLVFPEYYPKGIKGTLRWWRQQRAAKTVSHIITDSIASKKDIIKHFGVSASKISVVPLAANPEIKQASPEEIKTVKKQFGLPKNYVLYVGDINYNKNIPQLIKMMKYLPETVQLVCVGKNFFEQRIPEWQWIETQVAMSAVENRVHFLTDIPSDQPAVLSAIYSGALAYVQPSLYEGFGLPVLEAMNCRIPVVSSNTSSLPEVAGEYALYANPKAEELAAQVDKILGWSDFQRNRWTKQALRWSSDFTWQKVADDTVQVYKEVLE